MEGNIEKQGREEQGDKKEKTTLFYRAFNKEEYEAKRKNLEERKSEERKKEQDVQIELERQLENEALKQRFFKIAEKMQKGMVRAEVDVSGEKHAIAFNKLFEKGSERGVSDVVGKVKEGKSDLDEITAGFKLEWTYGRKDTLILDFKTPVKTLLRGGGEIEQRLKDLLTEQFAGTTEHYRRLEEKARQKPDEKIEPDEEALEEVEGALQNKGAEITRVHGDHLFSVIASFPGEKRQIHISTTEGEVWDIVVMKDNRVVKDLVNLKPQELMPVIESGQ
ncbi:MAG TPA: hypothetical protein VI588_03345 [Candidatus Gracilibacteria bacterium]|nr:hypothetical protein [Candidatus Gracilibacteria bacterium]